MKTFRRNRNVTLDTSVLIAWVITKDENSIVKKVVTKSITDDRLMLTDVIYEECLKYADKRKSKTSKDEISEKLTILSPNVVKISPIPPDEELLKKYKIGDTNDLKILYSVEMTDSVILVTYDDDFSDIEGVRAKIWSPVEYLYENEIEEGLLRRFSRKRK